MAMQANPSVQDARAHAERGSGWYAVLARSGLVAKGASYGLVGLLAIKLAAGHGGKATSREGALQSLAQHGFGKVVLALLALGLAGYALWRFVQAVVEREDADDAKEKLKTWGKRAGYAGRGVVYAGLTFSALKLLFGGNGEGSQDEKAHRTTAAILDWPAGRLLVGAAGIVIVGVGLWNVYRGLSQKFADKWRTGAMSQVQRTWGGRVGVVGHLARGVVFGLIGIFVTKAAIDYDPKDAIGLDGALRKLAEASYGPYLLGVTAAGLVCYGLYCLVDARHRDVSTG
jgi:O-antigen/teichoic acid export membrane protein